MPGSKPKFTVEAIVKALVDCKGMIYLAADKVGCHADTIYERAKTSPAIRAAMKTERGRFVDASELKLHNAVMNGEPWAIQMALKCLGKDRGYVERQEVTTPPDQPFQSDITSGGQPLDPVAERRAELAAILAALADRRGSLPALGNGEVGSEHRNGSAGH